MGENETAWFTTPCSLGNCIQVADLGADWFRVRSSAHTRNAIAATGDELRAFVLAAKAGQLDDLLGLRGVS